MLNTIKITAHKICLLALTINLLIFLASCDKNEDSETSLAVSQVSTSSAQREDEEETELSSFYVDYPAFPEYGEATNQAIKKAAYPSLEEFSEGGKYNVDCFVKHDVTLKNEKVISVAFIGTNYWRGAAHPTSTFHTVNVDHRTGNRITLSDVIDVNAKTVQLLIENNKNYSLLHEEALEKYCYDEDGLKIIANADTTNTSDSAFSYFTEKNLVVRVPWYDKCLDLKISWEQVKEIGIKYNPMENT